MDKEELVKINPLRTLEKFLGGGLGKGNIGVIASKKRDRKNSTFSTHCNR
jgi:hypothetical protein